jgi:hypothetical protein
MRRFLSLFDLVSGAPQPAEAEGRAAAAQLVLRAGLATAAFAALYGLAAGSTDVALAVGNLWKLPMVLLLSAVVALPAALLTWKLMGGEAPASALVVGLSAGSFAAALVLAALSPLVALYHHTTAYLGGALSLGVAGLAFLVGMLTLVRATLRRAPGPLRRGVALPLGVLCATHTLALVQFLYVASPILPETTVFDGGIDAMVDR